MSYAEVHFHLLPGIDDGPSSIEESIALAVAAAAEGTRTIVATPHVHPQHVTDPSTLPDRVHEVRAAPAPAPGSMSTSAAAASSTSTWCPGWTTGS